MLFKMWKCEFEIDDQTGLKCALGVKMKNKNYFII